MVLLATSVKASLYPTQPVADTIFRAGQSVALSWIDMGSSPSIEDTGKMDIKLYVANDVSGLS